MARRNGAFAALLAAGGLWAWQNRDKIQGWINDPSTRSKVQGWLGGVTGSSSAPNSSSTTGSSFSDFTYNGSPSSTNQFDPKPFAGSTPSSGSQFDPNPLAGNTPATGATRRIGTDINNPTQTPDDPFKAGI